MKAILMICSRDIAVYAVLAVILVPCARAQRVEPEVHEEDASAHSSVDERIREQFLSQKSGVRPAARSTWTISAAQPSRNIVRPTTAATAHPAIGASLPTSAVSTISNPVNAAVPISGSRPVSGNQVTVRHTGRYFSPPRDNATQSRSHARRIQKKPSSRTAQKQ